MKPRGIEWRPLLALLWTSALLEVIVIVTSYLQPNQMAGLSSRNEWMGHASSIEVAMKSAGLSFQQVKVYQYLDNHISLLNFLAKMVSVSRPVAW